MKGNEIGTDVPGEPEDLFEMANPYPSTTGLPMTVWVSPSRECPSRASGQGQCHPWQSDRHRRHSSRRGSPRHLASSRASFLLPVRSRCSEYGCTGFLLGGADRHGAPLSDVEATTSPTNHTLTSGC